MDNYSNTFSDESNYPAPAPQQDSNATHSSGLATASLVIGILSILLTCCGLSWVFGALGIILALLSRGAANMSGSAKAGLGLSIGGMVLGIAIIFFYIVTLFATPQGIEMLQTILYGYENTDSPEEFQEFLYDYLYDNSNDTYDAPEYEAPDDYDDYYDYFKDGIPEDDFPEDSFPNGDKIL